MRALFLALEWAGGFLVGFVVRGVLDRNHIKHPLSQVGGINDAAGEKQN